MRMIFYGFNHFSYLLNGCLTDKFTFYHGRLRKFAFDFNEYIFLEEH